MESDLVGGVEGDSPQSPSPGWKGTVDGMTGLGMSPV